MNELNDTVLAEITRRIVAVSNPQQIILFGSQARGDSDSDSESLGAEAARIYRALAGLSTPVDVVVARSEFVRRHRDVIGTVVRPALREGRVLYAPGINSIRTGYATIS